MVIFLTLAGSFKLHPLSLSLSLSLSVSSDGGAEPSALADDNGSEEDYSYEDLCRASPRYLQPGGEQLAINEVRGLIPHGSSRGRRPGFQGPEPTRTLLSDYFLVNIC